MLLSHPSRQAWLELISEGNQAPALLTNTSIWPKQLIALLQTLSAPLKLLKSPNTKRAFSPKSFNSSSKSGVEERA